MEKKCSVRMISISLAFWSLLPSSSPNPSIVPPDNSAHLPRARDKLCLCRELQQWHTAGVRQRNEYAETRCPPEIVDKKSQSFSQVHAGGLGTFLGCSISKSYWSVLHESRDAAISDGHDGSRSFQAEQIPSTLLSVQLGAATIRAKTVETLELSEGYSYPLPLFNVGKMRKSL